MGGMGLDGRGLGWIKQDLVGSNWIGQEGIGLVWIGSVVDTIESY